MYYLLKIPLNIDDEELVITPTEQIIFDLWHADEAYEHFARACYPTLNWEILGPEPLRQNYVIAYADDTKDLYNKRHDITLLIRAVDDDGCDDAAASWVLDYQNDILKAEWLADYVQSNSAEESDPE